MRRFAGVLVVGLLGFTACRTTVPPTRKEKVEPAYVGEQGCNVYDFATASEVPEGAKNLGWVSVPMAENDDATFIKLREKICEMGGDALSQPAWVRDEATDRPMLKANAWSLP
jgi:hypothetical protein